MIFYVFLNFFEKSPKRAQGQEEKSQHFPHKTQKKLCQAQKKRAGKAKVDPPAQEEGSCQVEPHPALFGGLGVEKKGGRHRQPEQQVQAPAQKPERDPAPQDPEQVVQHPRPQAQQHGPRQGGGLGLYRDCHQRNSRASSPPPWPGSSS